MNKYNNGTCFLLISIAIVLIVYGIVPLYAYQSCPTTIRSKTVTFVHHYNNNRHRYHHSQKQIQKSLAASTTKSTSALAAESSSSSTRSSRNSNSNSNSDSNYSNMNIGEFEEIDNNYLLRPPSGQQPRALIHFVGGAIVGAIPHITYRYLLERLANAGYLVVATPYQLSFDHLQTCDTIINRFEKIAIPLARAYGALPVIGIGHSCGALIQLLISSIFQDTPRAGNVLISFNNKPISDAVPFFDEFVTPFFTYVAGTNDTNTHHRYSGSDIISTSLDLAIASVHGEIPSDELLNKALKLLIPPGIQGGQLPFDTVLPNIVVPVTIRDAITTITKPYTIALNEAGVGPVIVSELLQSLQQVPLLINEVANGARDFIPSPALVKVAARRSYRARRTLIIQYNDDPIDESDVIEDLLIAASQVIRMKRPMMSGPTIDVQRQNLSGSHAAPLIAPPLSIADQLESLLGQETAKERLLYTDADQTVEVLVRWLEESNL